MQSYGMMSSPEQTIKSRTKLNAKLNIVQDLLKPASGHTREIKPLDSLYTNLKISKFDDEANIDSDEEREVDDLTNKI